jgi:peptidoglycan lytic transglycosylase B
MRARLWIGGMLGVVLAGAIVFLADLAMSIGPQQMVAPGKPFDRELAALRPRVLEAGVSPATFERVAKGLTADQDVLDLAKSQPEHVKTPWDYLSALVSERRIKAGQEKRDDLVRLLAEIESAYGVDRHILLAIWGVESNFGELKGERNVIRSLATLAAYDERRSAYWLSELVAAFRILERDEIEPGRMTGSWAGAGGHTQFMPSTYLAYAVDFDKDGKADIWTSVADALASTANYLKASGWRKGEPWGYEVALPPKFDYGLSAPGNEQPLGFWRELGVERPGARALPDTNLPLGLLLPAGANGPAFLVTDNFRAILRYNPAVAYALAVAHLSNRIAGGGPIAGAWPADEKPLGRAEREELQRLLTARGLDTGGIDGIIGGRSQASIRTFQRRLALPEDGYASPRLLELLRVAGDND